MTVERRFVVGLNDIRAVTLECKNCHTRVTVKPAALENISPWACQYCKTSWLSGEKKQATWFESNLMVLLRTLPRSLAEQDDKDIGVRILLEFDEPISGASSASSL
jgi:hypothetical protein